MSDPMIALQEKLDDMIKNFQAPQEIVDRFTEAVRQYASRHDQYDLDVIMQVNQHLQELLLGDTPGIPLDRHTLCTAT
jgi:hypothetical protein